LPGIKATSENSIPACVEQNSTMWLKRGEVILRVEKNKPEKKLSFLYMKLAEQPNKK
jgi:hypothetical protein